MPIVVVARQPRGIQAQHQSRLPEADLGNQPLEAAAAIAGGTGLAKVVINDLNPFLGPTKRSCSIDPCSPDAGGLDRRSTAARKCKLAWQDVPSLPNSPD